MQSNADMRQEATRLSRWPGDVLSLVEAYLEATGTSGVAFGVHSGAGTNFVSELRRGKNFQVETMLRAVSFIANQ